MARATFTCLSDLRTAGVDYDPVNASTEVASETAVEAAVAVLEADAAAPTQAHVNDLRTVWDALVADLATPPNRTAVVLSIDTAAVTTISDLRKAVAAILRAVEGSSYLTP